MESVHYAFLLLTCATVTVQKCNGTMKRNRCTSQPPCFDLRIVEKMAQHISKDVPGAEIDNILLKSKTFDKIRRMKYLHSCVLERIIQFYKHVLSSDQNYHPELIDNLDRVRNCIFKVKRCELLYRKANQQADLEIAEADMSAQEVAIFQLQKLNHASKRLNDTTILQTAMDELKCLHHYIPGRAFQKTSGRKTYH